MSAILTIEGKQFGRGRSLFPTFTISAPPEVDDERPIFLRDLLAHVVRCEVESFNDRREQRKLIHALTATQIDAGAEIGKVISGGRDEDEAAADVDSAIRVAIQGFEDGLFFVFADDRQYEKLDEPIYLRPDSTLTFLRLVALAGG